MIQYGQYTVPTSDEMVNFGVGQPSNSLLPLDKIKKGMVSLLSEDNPALLQYGDIPGYYDFRECFSKFLSKKYEEKVDPNSLFVTNGITGGLTLLCSIFAGKYKNIVVFVEEPTYFLAINIFKDFGMKIYPIEIEKDGINTVALENQIHKIKAESQEEVKFLLYTIPAFHNPTGYTMSHRKREQIGDLSEDYDMIVLADEVYQLLYFNQQDKPPLPLYYYGDNIISLGSFSKILAPSLRLGWIQTSSEYINMLINSGQLNSSGGINPVISAIVHNIIKTGELEKNINEVRGQLKKRCEVLCDVLAKNGENFDFERPSGGYFLWLKLPNINTVSLLPYAENNRVKYHSGNKFSANDMLKDYLRLSFSYYSDEDMKIGASRLVATIDNYLESIKPAISIIGSRGRLGSKIVDEVNASDKYSFHQEIGRKLDFIPKKNQPNVIIDVSSPEGTKSLVNYLSKHQIRVPLIVGTTGDLPMEDLEKYSKYSPVAIISNFSEGIPMMCDFIKNIDQHQWDVKIKEKHHQHKLDKPSGTAKTLASQFSEQPEIESIREGEIFGEHIISLESENEIMRVEHVAKNRDLFARGALRYIDWILTMSNGIYYGMEKREIEFQKYTGCGNDFVIINKRSVPVEETQITSFVRNICDRSRSVGADGVIMVSSGEKQDEVEWEYYNCDGSNVEMCGNGARCVAKYYYENVKNSRYFQLKNNFGIKTSVEIIGKTVKVSMPYLRLIDLPFEKELVEYLDNKVFCNQSDSYFRSFYKAVKKDKIKYKGTVEVGVPHVVFEVKDSSKIDVEKVSGLLLEKFSELKNYNLNYVEAGDTLILRTFERGVYGETLACGSGCCATASFYMNEQKNRSRNILVKSGDMLVVDFDNDAKISLLGKAEKTFKGFLSE